jgi:hypothetical protein
MPRVRVNGFTFCLSSRIGNGISVQIFMEFRERILRNQVLCPQTEKRGLATWEKVVKKRACCR